MGGLCEPGDSDDHKTPVACPGPLKQPSHFGSGHASDVSLDLDDDGSTGAVGLALAPEAAQA